VAQKLDDDVGRAENLGAIGCQLRAFFHIFFVGIARGMASPSFNEHFEARFFQVGNYGGDHRDSPFFRIDFPRYTKDHAPSFQKAFDIDADSSRLDSDLMISLPCIRTLVSGCKLQLRLLINVLAESGAERVPLFWERLKSCIRNAHSKSAAS
jgi:hypothetical protein